MVSKEKEELYKTVLTKKGKPDLFAIYLYLDIKAKLQIQSILETNYSYFANKYKCSTETIRKKFVLLENLGLIKRSFTTETLPSGYKVSNVLNLSLLNGGKNE